MPDLSTLVVFALASLALTATPGPDMLLIAARSATQGMAAGFATYLGVATGSFAHAIALAIGLSQLFLAVPFAYDLVRYLGAAYLLFLAVQAFRAHAPDDGYKVSKPHFQVSVMFRQGFISNILNPKVAIFFLALFPQFVDPEKGSVFSQIMILAVVLNVVGLVINGTVAVIASKAAKITTTSRKYQRFADYFLGTVFAGLAARLAFVN